MRISVNEAKWRLPELMARAEAGDEVILTCDGHAAVRLLPITQQTSDAKTRRSLLEAVRAAGAAKARLGPTAARSQDFLYGDDVRPSPT
jgi:prevent-host-death family protein